MERTTFDYPPNGSFHIYDLVLWSGYVAFQSTSAEPTVDRRSIVFLATSANASRRPVVAQQNRQQSGNARELLIRVSDREDGRSATRVGAPNGKVACSSLYFSST